MALGTLDHLRAALARFNFYILTFGTVIGPNSNSSTINKSLAPHFPNIVKESFSSRLAYFVVDEIGVYVKDSYDFNDKPGDDQSLGNWDKDDNSVGRTIINGGTSVSNSDFRKWRLANKKGGDYLIYSDILYQKLQQPNIVPIVI